MKEYKKVLLIINNFVMSKKEVEMEENFVYIQNLPFVLKIKKKIKKLKKENKLLNKLVLHLS